MRLQAELGDVDFITGDYLAEVNIAENAQAHAAGNHPGWEQTAWDGIEQTIDLLNEKRIKVVINGGAHNPRGLAEKVHELVSLTRSLCFFQCLFPLECFVRDRLRAQKPESYMFVSKLPQPQKTC
jgi:hypothetical protein